MDEPIAMTIKRINKLEGDGTLKAFCDVSIMGAFLIKGVKVVHGKHGLFVSMPREQSKNGKWYETVVPLNQSARAQLSAMVMEAYQHAGSLVQQEVAQ